MTQTPQGYQPPPQQAPPGGGYPQENAPGAVGSLVCGIIGVVIACTGLVLGIVALSLSKKAKQAIAMNPGRYGGSGLATAGFVLGIIATIWGAFWAIYILIFLIAGISTGFAAM